MVWSVQNNKAVVGAKWLKNYELAKKYYEKHGNLLVPSGYVVTDENGNKIHLGSWINAQRSEYKNKKLNSEKIELLDNICMIWNVSCYKNYLALIDKKFLQYYYGLLDESNVNELIKDGVFEYKDSEIIKGNALVLTRNILRK